MKWRVAVTATLLNLLVCTLFFLVGTYSAANLQNDLIEEELRVTCRLSAEMLDSAAFVDSDKENHEREQYLSSIADESGMLVVYIEDGEVAYQNFASSFDAGLLTRFKTLRATGEERVASGKVNDRLYCANVLSDGSILSYSKIETGMMDMAYKYSIVLPILLISLLTQFLILAKSVGRSDGLVKQLMSVLEDFTEGHFSSRITNVAGFAPELTAQYNATLARVQDRVFSQVRRNRVVGQMLNQMHNGLITADTNLNVTLATSNAGRLFGKDVRNAEGRSLREVFDNEDLEKAISDAIKDGSGNVFTTETEGMTPEGAVKPLRLYVSTMSAEGVCTGALVVIEDITEIRKLEQIRTDFAANVSHEMKTPLTSIKGFIETLQAGAIDNPEMARKFLDIMMVEAERLTRLINDILSITKLESGTENVEIQRLNLMDIIKYVSHGLLRPQADAKQVTIQVNNEDEPAYIMGNKDRVQQLVLNLIENGVKYNKVGGSVTVTVMQDSSNVNMIIADTGIGIKEEHLNRLFERFYRVDKGRSREMGGTGLGLAICKHIVNTMDGYIEVNSKYGEGTEFLVTLKKAPDEETIEEE